MGYPLAKDRSRGYARESADGELVNGTIARTDPLYCSRVSRLSTFGTASTGMPDGASAGRAGGASHVRGGGGCESGPAGGSPVSRDSELRGSRGCRPTAAHSRRF